MKPQYECCGWRLRQAEQPARLVNVASKLHELGRIRTTDPHLKRRYLALQAYSNSKLAQVRSSCGVAKGQLRNRH